MFGKNLPCSIESAEVYLPTIYKESSKLLLSDLCPTRHKCESTTRLQNKRWKRRIREGTLQQRRGSGPNLLIYIRYIYCPPNNLFSLGHTCPTVNPPLALVEVPLLQHNRHQMDSWKMAHQHNKMQKTYIYKIGRMKSQTSLTNKQLYVSRGTFDTARFNLNDELNQLLITPYILLSQHIINFIFFDGMSENMSSSLDQHAPSLILINLLLLHFSLLSFIFIMTLFIL